MKNFKSMSREELSTYASKLFAICQCHILNRRYAALMDLYSDAEAALVDKLHEGNTVILFGNPADPEVAESKRKAELTRTVVFEKQTV